MFKASADDIGTAIDNKIGGLGYITLGPNGLEYTREKQRVRLD